MQVPDISASSNIGSIANNGSDKLFYNARNNYGHDTAFRIE